MPLESRGEKTYRELGRKWQKRAVIRDRSRRKKKRKEREGALGVMGDSEKESCIRASASKNVILFFFTISKSNFITYTIPFYNTPYILKLYYFTFSLKYYFLIFLYYFFPIFTFFQDSNGKIFLGFRTFFSFFSFSDLHSPTVTFFLGYATLFFFQQWCWFQWPFLGLYHFFPTIFCFFKFNNYSKQPAIFFFFFERTCNFFFRKNMPNINILKLVGNWSTRQWRESIE